MQLKNQKCYACGKEATTREHAPPASFFPEEQQNNLIQVPSCEKHNNSNSKDVEYVRNIIAIYIETNDIARKMSEGKVKRSFIRSPKLKSQTFKDVQPVIVNGEKTGRFKVDMSRFRVIICAIAYAIYFRQFGKIFPGVWDTFTDSAEIFEPVNDFVVEITEHFKNLMRNAPYNELEMPHPEIFKCFYQIKNESQIIYRFVFYGGFSVFVISKPLIYT